MWPNPQETADMVTFTEKILNGKRHFLCSVRSSKWKLGIWKCQIRNKCFRQFLCVSYLHRVHRNYWKLEIQVATVTI